MPETLFFPYFGPNRRFHKRVVELRLDFGCKDETEFPGKTSDIQDLLLKTGILNKSEHFPAEPLREDRINWYSSLLAQTALLLQRKNGHRVDFFLVKCQVDKARCTVLLEHEHSKVGMAAVELALIIFSGKSDQLAEYYRRFSEFARMHALPLETEAIIRAASLRDIPCFQLEREPLTGRFNTGHRIRQNGLLSLGHGAACHILDGTFCVDKAGDMVKTLLQNPAQRLALVQHLGMPIIQNAPATNTDSRLFHLLVINGQITAVTGLTDSGMQTVDGIHASISSLALAISREIGDTPIAISLQARNLSQPLAQTGEGVLDFDLAPDLDRILAGCNDGSDLMDRAATELINWLFPDKSGARMPIVAITGTNGKTTTSRMVSHILQCSGLKPGLVSTDGIFLNGRQISSEDAGSFIGHARVLTSPLVDAAVLESHHRGLAIRGFAFDGCDVAVCLNVTEEHIETGEIESVEQMAGIKRSLLEQARGAAVLFADDSNCVSMLDFINAEKTCLVSLLSGVEQLRTLTSKDGTCFCVVESVNGKDWIIFHEKEKRLPVMPVSEIPATLDGTVRFNVSNAMHALASTYLLGIGIEPIRAALSNFHASQEMTPGRINIVDDFPFRIIMDFAHNPDGMKKVCEFIDLQKVQGRKLVAFAGLSKRTDDLNRKSAQAIAGHFDFYFCKDYEPSEPPKRRFTGPFMQQVLIEEGVPQQATEVVTFGRDVVFSIFDACKPGDLLLFLVGHFEAKRLPGYIQEYREKNRASPSLSRQ